MEDILIHIPDKIVVDDIKNYLDKKTDKHFFSDIYNGKTFLSPNYLIKYYSNKDIINLYEGGLGMGNYITPNLRKMGQFFLKEDIIAPLRKAW